MRVSFFVDDLLKIFLNERRSIAHSVPSTTALTVAARGRSYMIASSPKHGLEPVAEGLYRRSSTLLPPCSKKTAYSPVSTT